MGDFNLPYVDFDNGLFEADNDTVNEDDVSEAELWGSLIQELSLVQYVRQPTQKHGNVLDLIFCREADASVLRVPIVESDLFLGFSDHYPVIFEIDLRATYLREKKYVFDYKRMDFSMYRELIISVGLLERVLRAGDANEKWQIIRDVILWARSQTCPVREIIDRKHPHWSHPGIRRLKNKIGRLRQKLKSSNANVKATQKRQALLRQCNLDLKSMVNSAKVNHDCKLLDRIEDNRSALFNHVKSIKRGKQTSPPINDQNGYSLTNDCAKAEAFQGKFMQVFKDLPYESKIWKLDAKLTQVDFTLEKMRKKIGKMKRMSAPGADTLGPIMYKEAPDILLLALGHLYQFAAEHDQFPHDWAIAKVTPLWKGSGSKADLDKYRPVSLGITACKIGEAMYLEELNALCESEDVFGDAQHGFRAGRSTITNLTSYWDYVTSKVDKDQRIHVLNLDMSKAFDTLDIDYLLDSLAEIGVGGYVGRYFESWLKNRYQYVEINGSRSSLKKVGSGIQQGSLTGPTLFNIAASNMASRMRNHNVKFWQYCDDLKLVFQVDNIFQHQQVQEAIDELTQTASEAGLRFNGTKSTLMTFGRRINGYEFDLIIDGTPVPKVQETRDLGVMVQANSSFSSTLTMNLKKSMNIVNIVRSTIKVRSYDLLRKIYDCYFLPIITYGSELFTCDKPQVKNVMRKGFRAFWRLGGGNMTIPPDLLDPFQICVVKNLKFFKRIQDDKTCLKFGDMFKFVTNPTRAYKNQDLQTIGTTRCARYNFYSNVTMRWYNDLNPDLRNNGIMADFLREAINMARRVYPTPPYDLRPRRVIFNS